MPTVLQQRRGTAAQNNAFTGSAGELTVDLSNGTIRVHDGSTAGGSRLATKDSADAALAAAQGLDSANIVAIIDSSYVLARAPAQTLGTDFVDSAEARKTISVTDAGGDGSLSYNNSTGVLTYTGPSASEVRAHISAGEGIDISSGEISGEDATTSNKGIASFATANFTVASGAVSLKTDGINDTHIDFGTGTNQVSTADLPEETNLYFTDARAKSAAVADAINNGTTDVAPSQNAVFDALALKLDASSVPTLSTDFIDSAEAIKLIDSSYVQARQSGGEITIQEEGSSLSTAATTLNFVGSGVTASGSGTTKTITISGGGGSGTLDSAAVIALMDSGGRHTFGLVSVTNDASNDQSGQAQVQADTTRDLLNLVGGPGLAITTNASEDRITFTPVNQFDSVETINLIDSAYVLARAPAQTTADFPDSAGVNTLIDARVTLAYGKSLGFLDSAEIVQAAKDAITKPYIQAFDFLDSGEVVTAANAAIDSKVNASYINALNIIPTFGTDFVDSSFVTSQINNLVDAAPGALNTLNELAAAIGDDANFSTTITNSIAAKLDSAQTIDLIDSSYVQARQSAGGGTDPIFKTIAVAGQSSIVADTTSDTLTVVGSTGITVTTDAGTDTLTLATTDGDIVHDNLSGFVANEHIDHTSVSIATGTGLSGGGTIASTRTLKIDSSDLASLYSKVIVHDNTNGFVANEHIDHSGVSITAGTGLKGGGTIASTRDLAIDSAELLSLYEASLRHDNLSGFVANEHIDHSGVSIIAGNGLSGGGTIASSRTLSIDSANIDAMIDSNLGGSSVLIDGNGSTGGITLSDGNIDIRTGTGNVSKIKFYCETNNAHAQTLQAQPHSAGSSAVIVLPVASGTLLNADGSGASLTALNGSEVTSGTVAAARIDNLAASKITSGTFDSARIPILATSDIKSGRFDSDRLPIGVAYGSGGGGGGSQNLFSKIAVAGQTDVEADATTDTLTLVAGGNMTITTTAGSDTITFAASGGGNGVTVQDEGSSLSTLGTTLNFVGSGVVASGTGATKTITISGGGGGGGLDSAAVLALVQDSGDAASVDGLSFSVVSSMPGSPDSNTIYFVTS